MKQIIILCSLFIFQPSFSQGKCDLKDLGTEIVVLGEKVKEKNELNEKKFADAIDTFAKGSDFSKEQMDNYYSNFFSKELITEMNKKYAELTLSIAELTKKMDYKPSKKNCEIKKEIQILSQKRYEFFDQFWVDAYLKLKNDYKKITNKELLID